ncbi:MAG: CinA family nicotinamide mononucleotide deamidase-related protein [Geobacteraceae bacterium]|nr:CinA family nicotinamide mononucleotide deamidase-related protein [Geobacteraceae bacterium]
MRISTLSVGDELVCGQITDTNAGVIAEALLYQGLRVQRHMSVGDSEPDIIEALLELARNSDAIVVTGGLGPTADDLTARAAARATGRRLVLNDHAKAHVRDMSGRLASLMVCPLNDKQAMIPSKTTLIPNPAGTACGFYLMNNGCFMFFLPGVPSEMIRMLKDSVLPFLAERATRRRSIRMERLNVFGPCEAEVDEMLGGVGRPDQGLFLGICVTFPWMRITLRAEADSDDKAAELLAPAVKIVQERLHEYVFSRGEVTIDEAVAALFIQQGMTLALAESCTGGMIAQRITSISGSSRYFLEGAVTYSNAAKTRQVGVDAALLVEKGAVSSEVGSAMAKGVRRSAGSDLGLAVTGIAGPDGGSDEKPVGTVFISLSAPDGCWTKRFQFSGTRDEIRTITAWTALDWLRRYLLQRAVA